MVRHKAATLGTVRETHGCRLEAFAIDTSGVSGVICGVSTRMPHPSDVTDEERAFVTGMLSAGALAVYAGEIVDRLTDRLLKAWEQDAIADRVPFPMSALSDSSGRCLRSRGRTRRFSGHRFVHRPGSRRRSRSSRCS